MRVGYAGFHDRGFVLLLVVVEDCHLVSLYGELHLFAKGDVGGFRPGEVEFFADHVGLGGGLDREDLVGVGVVGGVGGKGGIGGAGRPGGGGGGGSGGPSIGVVEDATSSTNLAPLSLDGNVFTLGAAGAGGTHGSVGQPAGAAGVRVDYRKL